MLVVQLEMLYPLAATFLGSPIQTSILEKSSLDLGSGTVSPAVNRFSLPFTTIQDQLMLAAAAPAATSRMGFGMGLGFGFEKSMVGELAFAATEEFHENGLSGGSLVDLQSGVPENYRSTVNQL
eukprot:TRINITY_DN3475_c0_g3_i1.p1 TRINITY_DN3475_c0_g3~~TRINITY_DN3475_c0_g3_i1.p1  ORF type:complete len:124 (+),score=14.09 TRINITY_DN3475_c0_g3_i1:55-426(+)